VFKQLHGEQPVLLEVKDGLHIFVPLDEIIEEFLHFVIHDFPLPVSLNRGFYPFHILVNFVEY